MPLLLPERAWHVVFRDERQRIRAGLAQFVDEVGFRGLAKGELVDASHLSVVRGQLGSDGYHGI